MSKPIVVCLCGSTRFKEAFLKAQREETLAGRIVLSVGYFGHETGLDMTGDVKKMLDELHLRKIDLADEVLILNVGGYIGDSTANELKYATRLGKNVRYLELPPVEFCDDCQYLSPKEHEQTDGSGSWGHLCKLNYSPITHAGAHPRLPKPAWCPLAPGNAMFGFCPECGLPGVTRETIQDGNDRCAGGHVYPSAKAEKEPKPHE